jgi:hypothetical protein
MIMGNTPESISAATPPAVFLGRIDMLARPIAQSPE